MNAISQRLFRFKGGIKPDSHKTESATTPIVTPAMPERLIVPLHQNIGGQPKPLVVAGDRIYKGQRIGDSDGFISAAVHAPTSGKVVALKEHVAAHPSGLTILSAVIEPDGEDAWGERAPLDVNTLPPEAVRRFLQEAGVVGLGGAAFPSHVKLTPTDQVPMDTLIINAAECEPYITCDDRLMRERALDVVHGIALFRDLLQPTTVLIGVEDNKPEAAAALRDAVAAAGETFPVISVPTRYPAGGAKQLVRVLTGREIPGEIKRTTDIGIQVFNVATAYTAWRTVAHGEPVISRIVTVTGGVDRPGNYESLLGTPVAHLLSEAGAQPHCDGVIMGGPMMGFDLPSLEVPIVKASNCLIARTPAAFPAPPPEMPCIRCGSCAQACPHELQPFELYWHSRSGNYGKAQEYHLFDCIECGCCNYVCPSSIPLVQYFRHAKGEIWARERSKTAADAARERFEFRTARNEREKQEKAERLAKHRAKPAASSVTDASTAPAAEKPVTATEGDPAKAAIAAAVARAQKRTEGTTAQQADSTPLPAEPPAVDAPPAKES